MDQILGVKFRQASPPYNAGEVAGFAATFAQRLVDRGVGDFWPPELVVLGTSAPDILTGMDRAGLVTFGHEHLGMAGDPPAEVTDDELRDAIRGQVDPTLLAVPTDASTATGTDVQPDVATTTTGVPSAKVLAVGQSGKKG